MSDRDRLNLSVPESGAERRKTARRAAHGNLLLWAVLVLTVVNVGLLLWRSAPHSGRRGAVRLDADARKALALKLEDQGLNDAAVAAWKEYLDNSNISRERAARIWYRIGKIYQDAAKYEQALAAFYRSERFAKINGLDLDISRRIQECLETLGKFTALSDELKSRVSLNGADTAEGSNVVAEIGPLQITRHDLDRRIEAFVEQKLIGMEGLMPESDRNAQKEKMLKQFSSGDSRMAFLTRMIFEETLSREARESGLTDKPEVRAMLQAQERALLSSLVINRDVISRINITDADLRDYYAAHKADFTEKKDDKESVKSFEEVRDEIYSTLWSRKEQELQDVLFAKLRDKYDVVIHAQQSHATDTK